MKTDAEAAYIPMPKGRGFTPHFGKFSSKNVSTISATCSDFWLMVCW